MTELSTAASRRLKQTHRGSTLLGDVERHVMRESMKSDRDMSFLHPSDMAKTDFCHRRGFYQVTGCEASDTTANPAFQLQNIFAEGHAIHAKWQGWLQDMGVLWGRWECPGCGDSYFGKPVRCVAAGCGMPPVYREVPLRSIDGMVRGHADGAVECSDGKTRLIEIKSVGVGTLRFEAPRLFNQYNDGTLNLDGLWRAVTRPFPSHVRQGMIYLHLVQNNEALRDVDEIVFLYEFKATQAVKEFVVKFDPTLIEDRLEDARSVAASVSAGRAPERPAWAEAPGVSTCKSCPYKSICWELKDESGQSEPKRVVKRSSSKSRRKVLGT